jgi:hypothetical protein
MRERDSGFPVDSFPNQAEVVENKNYNYILTKINLGHSHYGPDHFVLDFPFKCFVNLPEQNCKGWVSFWHFEINGDLSQGMRADIDNTFVALEEALDAAFCNREKTTAIENFNTPQALFFHEDYRWQDKESPLQIVDLLSLDKYTDSGYSSFAVPEEIYYRSKRLWGIPTLVSEGLGVYFVLDRKWPDIFHLEVIPPGLK